MNIELFVKFGFWLIVDDFDYNFMMIFRYVCDINKSGVFCFFEKRFVIVIFKKFGWLYVGIIGSKNNIMYVRKKRFCFGNGC